MCFNPRQNKEKRRRFEILRRRRGFSLIEIMVVVVIIGMLAGAVAVGVHHNMDTAKINRAKSDIATIVDAVETHKLTKGRYPSSDEGLTVIGLQRGTGKDPWGRMYGYNKPGQSGEPFEVYTLGADGQDGGDGIEADIYSWQLGEVEEVSE